MKITTPIITDKPTNNKSLFMDEKDCDLRMIDSDFTSYTIEDDYGNHVKLNDDQLDIVIKTVLAHIRGEEICDILHDKDIDNQKLLDIIKDYSDAKIKGSHEMAIKMIKTHCPDILD